jgi:hypothetical protein
MYKWNKEDKPTKNVLYTDTKERLDLQMSYIKDFGYRSFQEFLRTAAKNQFERDVKRYEKRSKK